MLVLTRKEHEAINIGADIQIVILRTDGGAIKIGIEAPEDVQIIRSELIDSESNWTPHTPKVHRIVLGLRTKSIR